jgi:hypothetical protein
MKTFRFQTTEAAAERSRAGLSLLEVLIACGILALGLSGLAAVLPAASLRFGEAAVADRARFLAANAHAEMLNRGLTSAAAGSGDCVAFGHVATAAGTASQNVVAANSGFLSQRIDASRGFIFDDDLVFSLVEDGPANSYVDFIGPREYRESLVWGATLVPLETPWRVGGPATLSIAVFRKAGARKVVTLTRGSDGSWQCGNEADRLLFLKACSSVLLVQVDGTFVRPEWLPIRASWSGRVALTTDDVASIGSAATIQVIGFEGLVRVEHHPVTLQ